MSLTQFNTEIQSIQSKIRSCEEQILNSVNPKLSEYINAYKSTLLIGNKLGECSTALDTVSIDLEHDMTDVEVESEQLEKTQDELSTCRHTLQFLQSLHSIQTQLSSIAGWISKDDLREASRVLGEAQVEWKEASQQFSTQFETKENAAPHQHSSGNRPLPSNVLKIRRALQDSFMRKRAFILAQLNKRWSSVVKVESSSSPSSASSASASTNTTATTTAATSSSSSSSEFITIAVKMRVQNTALDSLIDALVDVHLLDDARDSLLHLIRSHHIVDTLLSAPLWSLSVNNKPDVHTLRFDKESSTQVRTGNQIDQCLRACRNVEKFVQFFAQSLGGKMVSLIGNQLSDELCMNLIDRWLVGVLPTDVKQFELYQREVCPVAIQLEDYLIDCGWLSLQSQAGPLRLFVNDINKHFADKQRRSVLEKVRAILTSTAYSSQEVRHEYERGLFVELGKKLSSGGEASGTQPPVKAGYESGLRDSGVFRLPTMHVTDVAQSTVEMVHNQMIEACECRSGQEAMLYFQIARDILDMFRAVVPTVRAQELKTNPQLAMLMHNDCVYISFHLLTLGQQYRTRLTAPLNETATFIDMVPVFRDMAEYFILQHLKLQRESLHQMLELAQEFRFAGSDEHFAAIDSAIRQVTHRLQHLQRLWSPICSAPVLQESISHLLNAALVVVVDSILRLDHISDSDAHQLHYALYTLAHADLLDSSVGKEKVRYWNKFYALCDLLEADLHGIKQMWQQARLVGFTADELQHFIRSIFEESPLRTQVLQVISQQQQQQQPQQ